MFFTFFYSRESVEIKLIPFLGLEMEISSSSCRRMSSMRHTCIRDGFPFFLRLSCGAYPSEMRAAKRLMWSEIDSQKRKPTQFSGCFDE